MNDTTREVLIILQEECAEVIQDVSKCFRFGLDQVYLKSETEQTQVQNLEKEIGDLCAMIEILIDQNIGVTTEGVCRAKLAKYEKLKRWSNIFKDE